MHLNHEKLFRLYREERLTVRRRGGRKRALGTRAPVTLPQLGLDEVAAVCGLPGKIGGHGSEVEAMVAAGEVEAVRRYCEVDTLNLYGLYLRHGLLNGRMSPAGYKEAIDDLSAYLEREGRERQHLDVFQTRWGRQMWPVEVAPYAGTDFSTDHFTGTNRGQTAKKAIPKH